MPAQKDITPTLNRQLSSQDVGVRAFPHAGSAAARRATDRNGTAEGRAAKGDGGGAGNSGQGRCSAGAI